MHLYSELNLMVSLWCYSSLWPTFTAPLLKFVHCTRLGNVSNSLCSLCFLNPSLSLAFWWLQSSEWGGPGEVSGSWAAAPFGTLGTADWFWWGWVQAVVSHVVICFVLGFFGVHFSTHWGFAVSGRPDGSLWSSVAHGAPQGHSQRFSEICDSGWLWLSRSPTNQ